MLEANLYFHKDKHNNIKTCSEPAQYLMSLKFQISPFGPIYFKSILAQIKIDYCVH